MSLAGTEAAQARHKASSTPGFYNLKVGPTAWSFSSGLILEYNDNTTYRENNAESDFVFTPRIAAHALWPLSDKNSLNFDVGLGYQFYSDHSELNRVLVDPGSELSFDLYAGDFWINFHDRFSLLDASQDPTVANLNSSGNYSFLQNAAGLTATWDLNKVLVRSGYDHQNNIPLRGLGAESSSDLLFGSVSYAVRRLTQVGIETSGGFSHFSGVPSSSTNHLSTVTDATHRSIGPFYETQVSEYVHLRAGIGYVAYQSEANGTNQPDFDGYYAQLGMQHRVNEFINYSLTAGRNVTFGFSGGAIDLYSASLQANWNIVRATTLSTTFLYEHGTQLSAGSEQAETFTRYGANLALGRTLTRNLSAMLHYQFYRRESDLPNRGYTANIVGVSFAYKF